MARGSVNASSPPTTYEKPAVPVGLVANPLNGRRVFRGKAHDTALFQCVGGP